MCLKLDILTERMGLAKNNSGIYSHVMIDARESDMKHYLTRLLRENGNSDSLIVSSNTLLIFSMLHTKKLEM